MRINFIFIFFYSLITCFINLYKTLNYLKIDCLILRSKDLFPLENYSKMDLLIQKIGI